MTRNDVGYRRSSRIEWSTSFNLVGQSINQDNNHNRDPDQEPRPAVATTGIQDTQKSSRLNLSEAQVKSYTYPYLSFSSENPTVFHTIAYFSKKLKSHGFSRLSERDSWNGKLSVGGKYFVERNGSSLIAFVVGKNYHPGNGASIIASHADVLTTRLKPISTLSTKAGYVQLGVAPYAGGLNNTWWDRDLGIGGRVLIKDNETGKIDAKLVKLGWPIARIPTLAPHFGAAANNASANKETQMVPIIGLDNSDVEGKQVEAEWKPSLLGGAGTFAATQPERLVKAIAGELNVQDCTCFAFLFTIYAKREQIVPLSIGS